LYLVGILFPRVNDDAQSKSHQICLLDITFSRLERLFQSLYEGNCITKFTPLQVLKIDHVQEKQIE